MALPTVSVVVPCLDDAGPLAVCLASLAAQEDPVLEVIVVDNGCRDGSRAVAARFGARIVREPLRGIPAAAAAGYDAAQGEIIARCDADSVLPPDWAGRIGRQFAADGSLAALTGPGRFYGLPRPLARPLSALYLGSYFLAMGAALGHCPLFGSNLALRRSCWREIRGQVHRRDAEMHDDVCLSLHLGPRRRIRYDSGLRVGISVRAVTGAANIRRRFRRAFHTLAAHWPEDYPWRRWSRRRPGNGCPGSRGGSHD
ncbi:glycosyltransferase family 2 protein [Arthrobacter sp. I2-34]|uniref:4,4'-diaponeurosporenoate glycosyltransferase n=1 Tax=Arthrobacter hankyongi TaxID=2904801 RepID=A0ABS9LDU6_9MICC|nr:glycosyltransferase family 2 protein [Arthrobacter hankyongi]MCG2624850.1 glycosyltransferase family 2 protein [Arthrobacter hankyongi]